MLESKRRAIIFFILSLLLALTAGLLVLKKVQAINDNLGTMVKVYVAKGDISSRAIITPENVTTDEIPKKYLKDYHVTKTEDLLNKVAVVPLSDGDMITKNILKQASAVVEEKNRLVTLMQSDRVYFDEPLEALDRVDIIVSERFSGKEETKFFMKDVKVARVAKEKSKFKGIQVEIPQSLVPELIHMQNYADSVRIIKSNVGQSNEPVQSQLEENQEEIKENQASTENEAKDKKDSNEKQQNNQSPTTKEDSKKQDQSSKANTQNEQGQKSEKGDEKK
ncbi:flagella basal body P-ring formation protein FlgA [Heyndrickxia oleronia]|uniref:flagella basal body P-ring formation protein FlgA n=1 Tax=Heyndrickxia oleronia TaxID=38875 RepID=UPI00203BF266|nr:flagella basal body P-ring formation protein FlgA [Heyndrickxia oleronia]MCM3241022.1 flagella basal body P-ring formation protein FlgA [Heyndrickxia oleronia]